MKMALGKQRDVRTGMLSASGARGAVGGGPADDRKHPGHRVLNKRHTMDASSLNRALDKHGTDKPDSQDAVTKARKK